MAKNFMLLASSVVDFFLILISCHLAYWIRFGQWGLNDYYLLASSLLGLLVVTCQASSGSYLALRESSLFRQAGRVFSGWLLAVIIGASAMLIFRVPYIYSRLWLLITIVCGFGLTVIGRLCISWSMRYAYDRGVNLKRVVLVRSCTPESSEPRFTIAARDCGFEVVLVITLGREDPYALSLPKIVKDQQAHELWLNISLENNNEIKSILHIMRHSVVNVRYFPCFQDFVFLNRRVRDIGGLYAIDLNYSPLVGQNRFIKRVEDLALGILLFILVLPVCFVIAVMIKSTSPGPVLFKQYRTGVNGKRFKVYKFRSMAAHLETDGRITQAKHGDSRITKIGAFLRRTSLDELPQLYNVLQGKMSLVGPRPHVLVHNTYYSDLIDSYMQRHRVKPGITGWAQINGYRGETDTLEKMEKRIEHDLWYIENWTLKLDLKIILLTIFKGFFNKHP